MTVADLGEGPGRTGPGWGRARGGMGPGGLPLFWVKQDEMTEGRKADWASKLRPGPLLS